MNHKILLGLIVSLVVLTACTGKPSVVILSPPHGSQFREGETVAVQSTSTDATGIARVELLVDGAVVRLDAAPTPQTTFTLIQNWQAVPGTHTLMVRAYNTSGAVSEPAAISISVGRGMAVPPTLAPGVSAIEATKIAELTVVPRVVTPVAARTPLGSSSIEATKIAELTAAARQPGIPTATANIPRSDGLGDWVPSLRPKPQVQPPTDIAARFIQLYQQHFGLRLSAPAILYAGDYPDSASTAPVWASAAFIGNNFYEIWIRKDGTVFTLQKGVNQGGKGVCRPLGRYRALVVFVDYGNTGISRDQAFAALHQGLSQVNQRWLTYATQIGLSQPLLQIEITPVHLAPPPSPGTFLAADQVRARTGEDPARYDLLIEVFLDAKHSVLQGGAAFVEGDVCNPRGATMISIAFNVENQQELQQTMPIAVFHHEFAHLTGWEHFWHNGDASVAAQKMRYIIPTLLWGWHDTDGDGIIEIQDPTPYGMRDAK